MYSTLLRALLSTLMRPSAIITGWHQMTRLKRDGRTIESSIRSIERHKTHNALTQSQTHHGSICLSYNLVNIRHWFGKVPAQPHPRERWWVKCLYEMNDLPVYSHLTEQNNQHSHSLSNDWKHADIHDDRHLLTNYLKMNNLVDEHCAWLNVWAD